MSSLNSLLPYQSGFLPEQDGHRVFYQLFGNPSGTPIVFLHGGPGCGFEIEYLPLFDLDKINLITFDQRGCGQSTPLGQIENNTTQSLMTDAERLREQLGIDSWMVCGHSWGATLAILYGLTYPQNIKKICIASFFGGLRADQEWSFEGIKKFFPAEVEDLFKTWQPEDKNLRLDDWLYKNLSSDNQELAIETAYCLLKLENQASHTNPRAEVDISEVTQVILTLYKMLFYYGKNDFFITWEDLYNSSANLPPTTLVHGRLDFDCLPEQAIRLQKSYPQIDLRFVQGGFHSVFESPMFEEFKRAIKDLVR